jgi:SAM-dependent methyltransferase
VEVASNPPNVCAGGFGAVYDFCIERPWLAGAIGRLLWGARLAPMYASLDELAALPPGSTILDVPCGGGLALRALGNGSSFRYVGCDISERMLERARRRVRERRLAGVELLRADIRRLPLSDGFADACLCYNGLQQIAEPQRALAELARCLRPRGTLVGCALVANGSRRQRAILSLQGRRGQAVPGGTAADLRGWLRACGLSEIEIAPERGFVIFSARKAGRP